MIEKKMKSIHLAESVLYKNYFAHKNKHYIIKSIYE